jgi:hypothetical protein
MNEPIRPKLQPLTVGQLRNVLARFPDDLPVYLDWTFGNTPLMPGSVVLKGEDLTASPNEPHVLLGEVRPFSTT